VRKLQQPHFINPAIAPLLGRTRHWNEMLFKEMN